MLRVLLVSYIMCYESKPESGYQVRRGSRHYMSADQAIKAAKKIAATNCNASAMQTTSTGNLVAVLWSTVQCRLPLTLVCVGEG